MSSKCKCEPSCDKVKSPDSFKNQGEVNAYFLNMVSIIAGNNNCLITGIDETITPPTVYLSGSEENEIKCAYEIGAILKKFLI